MLLGLFHCQIVYSQQTVLDNKGDTLICTTLNQYSFLIKSVYKVQELTELDSLNNEIIDFQDSVITNKEIIIENQILIISNQNNIVKFKDEVITILNNELTEQKKSTRTQKVQKWISIGIGSLLTSYVGVLYLTK